MCGPDRDARRWAPTRFGERTENMTRSAETAYKSPLHKMTQTTPTCLWNDSASIEELTYSIEHGAVGAKGNPVIVVGVLKKEMSFWKGRIQELIKELPTATEEEIGWQLVREISIRGAGLLKPIFDAQHGKNGRLSIQTDPRLFRDTQAIEEATYRGVSINATVSFTLPQCLAVADAVERGLQRRAKEGKEIASMGPVCTLMVGRLDDWLKVVMERENIAIDPGYLEWAGVAVLKKAYRIV